MPNVVEGQVYTAGEYRVMCGDVEAGDLPKVTTPDIEVVYTDPPWNAGIATQFRGWAGKPRPVDFNTFLAKFCDALAHTTASIFYIEMGKGNIAVLRDLMFRHGVTEVGTWGTTYGESGKALLWCGTRRVTDWHLDGTPEGLKGKPLIRWALSQFGIDQGRRVLDPCCGQGMTIQVCMERGIPATGMELNPKRIAQVLNTFASKGLRVR